MTEDRLSLARGVRRCFARKSVATLQRDAVSHGLRRVLGPVHLALLGVGCTVGAGIYVMPGHAAAHFAGPAVVLAFLLAGAGCAFIALCYAEMCTMMPVSGSAYTYCYASMGEVVAWALGWLLLLEFGLSCAMLAVGFSGYFVSLLHNFGLTIPASMSTPTVHEAIAGHGAAIAVGTSVNAIAAVAVLVSMLILVVGISTSASVNSVLVVVKVLVLVAFIAVGVGAVHFDNWVPFIPQNEGGFTYGWQGIIRAASILFYAFMGFETVSTATSESRNPQKDMPIGILGALVACTVLYIGAAGVLTGIVPFRELGVPDPIALAADRMGHPQFSVLVKAGALAGLSSVLLGVMYGQTRIAFAMSRDGLLPPLFSRLHSGFRTPWLGTLALGSISALGAALLPLSLLADLVSLGSAFAFMAVSVSLMWLRSTQPQLARPFSVPFGGVWIGRAWIGFVPAFAVVFCLMMIVPVLMDIVGNALHGQPLPALILVIYTTVGILIYFGYGMRRSTLAATLANPP
jgi:basic amino acid/polyamine antiporter, APA family